MADHHLYLDFPDGKITSRIVDAVSKLPLWDFISLAEQGKLRFPVRTNDFAASDLTYRNLYWNCISDYAEICNMPLSRFIYGDKKPERTSYSYFDTEILPLLDVMPTNLIRTAGEVMSAVYSNPRFYIPATNTPSAKLMEIAFSEGKRTWTISEKDAQQYDTDISSQLEIMRSCKQKERIIFHIDYILDLCAFWHLSPHFVFSLKGNLLCERPEGDDFFDKFCLLPRSQQVIILTMLIELYPGAQDKLPDGKWAEILAKIDREGGVVSCN